MMKIALKKKKKKGKCNANEIRNFKQKEIFEC